MYGIWVPLYLCRCVCGDLVTPLPVQVVCVGIWVPLHLAAGVCGDLGAPLPVQVGVDLVSSRPFTRACWCVVIWFPLYLSRMVCGFELPFT